MHMFKAIHVKYLPTTNFRPSRYKATAHDGKGGSLTRSYDFEGADKARVAVASELATKLGWHGSWFGGCLPDGSYAFVLADTHDAGFICDACSVENTRTVPAPSFFVEKKD